MNKSNQPTYGRGLLTPQGIKLQESLNRDFIKYGNNPYLTIENNQGNIAEQAEFMMWRYGVSHRNLPVGAAGVGVRGQEIVLLEGANYSPNYGDPKQCAEVNLLKQANSLKVDRLLRVMTAAPAIAGLNLDINGLEADTLHPCVLPCRETFRADELVKDALNLLWFDALSIGREGVVAHESFNLIQLQDRYRGIARPLISAEIVAANKQ